MAVASGAPAVADQPVFRVEHRLVEHLALVEVGSADDELEASRDVRRGADSFEVEVEVAVGRLAGVLPWVRSVSPMVRRIVGKTGQAAATASP